MHTHGICLTFTDKRPTKRKPNIKKQESSVLSFYTVFPFLFSFLSNRIPGAACVRVSHKKFCRQYWWASKGHTVVFSRQVRRKREVAKGSSSPQCFLLLKYHQVSLLLHRQLLLVCNNTTPVTQLMTALPSWSSMGLGRTHSCPLPLIYCRTISKLCTVHGHIQCAKCCPHLESVKIFWWELLQSCNFFVLVYWHCKQSNLIKYIKNIECRKALPPWVLQEKSELVCFAAEGIGKEKQMGNL